ncbi:ABC transporter permease [Haloimpatiens sp. FM7330]|uniref:ABC transporter permease n=1 Tax=Haloimpatiens sp. FM7330 TaxID=3298610 RepID=UPI0036383035
MLKVLKNEIIKMFNGKKFYVLSTVVIMSIVIMAVMGISDAKSEITAENFLVRTLFGMLMKPIVPMFMVLVISETLTEDYTHGTMKFSLMTPIKKSDFIIGKLLFIALYALIFLIISFVGSYIVGAIVFGLGSKGELLNNFIYNVKVYASVTLPLLSFSSVISFIALLINNSGAVIGLGIGIDVIMMMIDSQMKNVMYFTFSGGMYAYEVITKLDTHSILNFSLTACIYICLSLLLSMFAIEKKDIVL